MRYKYPRTPHLFFSPGASSDDKMLTEEQAFNNFNDKSLMISIKKDGECTALYSDYIHARSLDSNHHPSRDWVKRFHSEISHNIPEGYRIYGENLFAKHSISYDNLNSYFYGFAIYNDKNICLSWKETQLWFDLIGITPVEVIKTDLKYNPISLLNLGSSIICSGEEGYVLRNQESFYYDDFKYNVAKYVRANHVQTSDHWQFRTIIPNRLK